MLKELFGEKLGEAVQARALLTKKLGVIVGTQTNIEAGHYLENYAQCLLNRQIDIFDDAVLLLKHDRIASACTISRGMIETYAFAKLMGNEIIDALEKKTGKASVEDCLQIVLRYTNSSRIKTTEQKKVSKEIFKVEDYSFTEQALERLRNALATSEHVMDALRDLYKEELLHTKANESSVEFTYDALSEWVHPSQTSIFHNYVPATHMIHSSNGDMHLYDVSKFHCVRALHFITDSHNIYNWLLDLGREMSKREKQI